MRRSISRILSSLAEIDPDRVVVVADDESLTAQELDRRSNRLARGYRELGVQRDDLVLVALRNSAEYVIVCAAIWKAGATPQPVSPDLHADEADEIERLAGPSLVIGRPSTRVPAVPAGWRPDDFLSDERLDDAWAQCWKAPTSSGSTGRPKVVLAAGPALLDDARAVAPFLPMAAVQLVSGPLGHSATFTYAFRGLMTGHCLIILPRFDERRVLTAIAEHRVSWALLVPTMIHRLLRLPPAEREGADLSSLRTVLHMGAPIAAEDKRGLIDWVGAETVVEVYAGSESNGLTMIRGDEWLAHPGSVGRPIGGTSVRILRADGGEAAPGEPGRIWLHREGGPSYRYLGGESRRTDDGWDTLGDLGFVDDGGYLFVLDRAGDLILRGGVNVYPADVERILEAHPAVRSAVAYGVPDAELGQAVEAVVDVAEERVSADRILDETRDRLGPERRIRSLRIVHAPLRNDAGKLRRSGFAAAADPAG
ncbi:AMP-binding protein [Microbacteriaceae bacterium VKM Ac-2854]|nr:AMP-binding protein [Microbacteriaceae bacterium VKM Ac-2854]